MLISANPPGAAAASMAHTETSDAAAMPSASPAATTIITIVVMADPMMTSGARAMASRSNRSPRLAPINICATILKICGMDDSSISKNVSVAVKAHAPSIQAFVTPNRFSATDQLELGLGLTYQDEFFVNSANAVTIPDYTRIDAAAIYTLDNGTILQLNIENLLDETYFPDAHSNTNISTGAPLNARFTIRTRF